MSSQTARRDAAAWLISFIGMIPGVSRSSMESEMRTHWRPLVTPGLLADLAARLLTNRLIRADFPTFGNPSTMHRIGRGSRPRFFLFSLTHEPACSAARFICGTPSPNFALVKNTSAPSSCRAFFQTVFATSGAKSCRFIATSRGRLLTHFSMRGCRVEDGMRQSLISMMTSTTESISFSFFSALAMCPGYQLMSGLMRPSWGILSVAIWTCALLLLTRGL
mmetsp:Transcript_5190/g.15530  ORF Transcript_5190/g.15530 Transcript_5190/m.15530 type:complete len:221 (-) Transcript_5190:172-834(-)